MKFTKVINSNLTGLLNIPIITKCCNKSKDYKLENDTIQKNNIILKNYKQLTLIQSCNSNVYKANNIKTNKPVIIKEMHENLHIIDHEYNILTQLNHDNIIKVKSKFNNLLILEFIEGIDMFYFINQTKFIRFNTILSITLQLSELFLYLKRQNIIHCDVKPENIMVTKKVITNGNNNKEIKYKIKLIDFGSAVLNNTDIIDKDIINSSAKIINNYYSIKNYYTPEYVPPEKINSDIITEYTDIWALGCVLYMLVTKQHPFNLNSNLDTKGINENILNQNVSFDQIIWKIIPIEFQNIIKRMLEKDVTKRISIEEVCEICNNFITK